MDDPVVVSRAGYPVAGVRITRELVATVNDHSDVRFIAEHAVPFLRVSADRAVVPLATTGAQNTFGIQASRDCARR
nr:hypothetical protein [Roseovarius salinarum]